MQVAMHISINSLLVYTAVCAYLSIFIVLCMHTLRYSVHNRFLLQKPVACREVSDSTQVLSCKKATKVAQRVVDPKVLIDFQGFSTHANGGIDATNGIGHLLQL
jgi:hypothetical protein